MRKSQVYKTLLKLEREFKARYNKEYIVKIVIDSTVDIKEVNNQMLGLYYLVMLKNHPKKENIWKSLVILIYF